ncbi:metabotropic glutamate receptor 4-like [Asterias amurensis]|uniref:metabotropic glutamate receptor 4-like n=1 Tax=Asterias amurensis TaxID=7602 RepID=UPI003AB7AE84
MRTICLMLFLVKFACGVHLPSEVCKMYNAWGNVYIGGIFSLHGDGGSEEKCEVPLPVSALQLTEAMVFAVNAINQNPTVLPNITLGFRIYDDCSEMNYALWESMALVIGTQPVLQNRSEKQTCKLPGPPPGQADRVVAMGFVGAGTHSSTELVLSTATLFKRPVISYGATSYKLLEDNEDGYFFTTIPSNRQKARAMVDLLVHFEWTFFLLVAAGDDEACDFGKQVIELATDAGLCIRELGHVEDEDDEELKRVVNKLKDQHVTVLLVSSSPSSANAVLEAASTAPFADVTWIVSSLVEEEDFTVENQNTIGGLFIRYHNPELVEFEEHFRSLVSGVKETSNPWFDEFFKNADVCQTSIKRGFSTRVPTLAPVIDAVFAMAYALNKTINQDCEDGLSDCLMNEPKVDNNIRNNVNGVSFLGTKGDFRFQNGSVPGHFDIRNKQWVDGIVKMTDIGSWRSDNTPRLEINNSLIRWSRNSSEVPISRCGTTCDFRKVVVPVNVQDAGRHGCYKCELCTENKWPINNYACAELNKIALSWQDPLVVILASVSSIGLLLCGLTSYGMIRHRHHPLIKATSRELSAVNIVGITLAFVAVFPLLSTPSPGICGLAKTLYVVSFTVMYAPFFLKVNRIYRIFDSSKKSAKQPRFTESTAQLVIVAILIVIQFIIIIISALVEQETWTSEQDLYGKTQRFKTRNVFCKFGAAGIVASMSYNFLLLLACCFFAYKARNVPGNFNEARFYVISIYTNMLPIAAAVPLFLYAEQVIHIAVAVCLMPIFNGYVTLLVVYIPKLYVILTKKTDEGGRDRSLGEPSRMGISSTPQDRRSFVMGKGSGNKVQPFDISNTGGDD